MGAKPGQGEPRGIPAREVKAAVRQAFDFLPAGFTSAEQFQFKELTKLLGDKTEGKA